jgi:hypothetical protein
MPNTVTSEREAPIGACQCGGHDGGGPLLLSAERAAGLLGISSGRCTRPASLGPNRSSWGGGCCGAASIWSAGFWPAAHTANAGPGRNRTKLDLDNRAPGSVSGGPTGQAGPRSAASGGLAQRRKEKKGLDGAPVGGRMAIMERIAPNLILNSKLLGPGKVCPQGWPRRDTASLSPGPTYLKGCNNGTYRTHT